MQQYHKHQILSNQKHITINHPNSKTNYKHHTQT